MSTTRDLGIRGGVLVSGFAIAVAVTVSPAAIAQHGEARQDEGLAATTRDGRLAPLLDGMGDYQFTVTTRSALAQRYFNQGLALTYGFNHAEAIRAYRETARLDPDCAMAAWGEAYALGPNINVPMDPAAIPEAWAALQRAVALRPKASELEQAYIDALAARYSDKPDADRAALDRAFAGAMKRVHERFPHDDDAAVLYADALMNLMPWDYWNPDGSPRPGTQDVIRVLETVISRNPRHAGAHHAYIHIVEASTDPFRGERSADALGALIPGAGHLVHMPSHIYLRIGRYEDAVNANVRAVAVDEGYISQCRAQGIYPAAYYPHNIHFLWAAETFRARSGPALEAARKVASRVAPGMEKNMQQMLITPLAALVRFGRWQDVLNEPRPSVDHVYETAFWRFARGMALAGTGKVNEAKQELTRLTEAITDPDLESDLIFINSSIPGILRTAEQLLAGEIARASGDLPEAIAHFDAATRHYDALRYNEPEDWFYPPRHALGAALLDAGRPAEAEIVYWHDLARHPENPWALTGLLASLKAQGEEKAAYLPNIEARLVKAMKDADVKLTSSR